MKVENFNLQSSVTVVAAEQYPTFVADSKSTEEDVPERSKFWFKEKFQANGNGHILDGVTIVYTLVLTLFSFVVFWPLISKITFEEAFFTPLAPFLMNLISLAGFGANEALRILFISSFMLSTAGIYLFARDLTHRQIMPILTAIIYLLPPIPLFILTLIRRDLFQAEVISAKSFFTIVYGDGAHFMAMAIIPFAALFLLRFLKEGKTIDLASTVFLATLILLANRSQAMNLFIILAVLTLTEFFIDQDKVKISRFLKVLILSLGLVSFWYTPTFWSQSVSKLLLESAKNLGSLFPLPFILTVLSLLFSFVFFARKQARQAIFASFLLFIIFLGLTLGWLISGKSFVPHPQRLIPILNMFGALVLALSITAFLDKFKLSEKFRVNHLPLPFKISGALVFSVVSLTTLTIAGYLASPYIIKTAAGPQGFWTKIRQDVAFDRSQTMAIAGGNFQLISIDKKQWEMVVGASLSLIFLVVLGYLIFEGGQAKMAGDDYD